MKLRRYRKVVRRLTLAQAAAELGLTAGSLSRYERGRLPQEEAIYRRVFLWSGGEVTPNDWVDLPALRADEAAA